MATYPDIYRIKNTESGEYLTMTTATPQQPVTCAATQPNDKSSHWRIASNADGTHRIKNEQHGLELFRPTKSVAILGDNPGFSFHIVKKQDAVQFRNKPTGGTVLQQEQKIKVTSAIDDGSKKQRWILETVSSGGTDPKPDPKPEPGPDPEPEPKPSQDPRAKPGHYLIKNVKTGTVVDLEKCIPGDNVKIFGYGWNSGENQKWDIQPSGNSPYMTLRCLATNKYPVHPTPKEGEGLISSSQALEYVIIPADKGFYIGPVQKPGCVWALKGESAQDETPIELEMNHGLDHQKWRFEWVG